MVVEEDVGNEVGVDVVVVVLGFCVVFEERCFDDVGVVVLGGVVVVVVVDE